MKKNKNIKPLNNKGQAHGYWEAYWPSGHLMMKTFYHNGKGVGYSEWLLFKGLTEEKSYHI